MKFIFTICCTFALFISINSLESSSSGNDSSSANPCKSPLLTSTAYTSLKSDSNVKLHLRWLVQDETICMELRLEPQSDKNPINRVAFGLSRDGSMVSSPPANVYLARGDIQSLKSYTINPTFSLTEELDVEWKQNSLVASANGAITFSIYRPLVTTSKTEVPISSKDETQHIIWSYGYGWPMKGHSDGDKGSMDVNLLSPPKSSGESSIKTDEPSTTDANTNNNENDKGKTSDARHLSAISIFTTIFYIVLTFYLC